jgi:hypothetical protein
MRLLKLLLISIVVFGLLILGLSLLFPSQVRISRAIDIDVTKEKILNGVGNLQQWQYWNDMTAKEELTNKRFSDSLFSSDQMLVKLISASPEAVITNWNRNQNESITSGFQLIGGENSTTVQWYFDFKLKWYPWEKFGSIIFDKQLGPPMESSLTNLKKFMENKQ